MMNATLIPGGEAGNATSGQHGHTQPLSGQYEPFSGGEKIGIGVAVGLCLFLMVFVAVGFLEMYIQRKTETEYQRMARDESFRVEELARAGGQQGVCTVSELLAAVQATEREAKERRLHEIQMKKSRSRVTFMLPGEPHEELVDDITEQTAMR